MLNDVAKMNDDDDPTNTSLKKPDHLVDSWMNDDDGSKHLFSDDQKNDIVRKIPRRGDDARKTSDEWFLCSQTVVDDVAEDQKCCDAAEN